MLSGQEVKKEVLELIFIPLKDLFHPLQTFTNLFST